MLIVDDNAVNRRVFVKLLKETQIHVDEASGGEECLELVKKQAYDLIFLDHMMPDMDGIMVLHHMREMTDYPCEKTPVIALTANAVTGAREMYLREGFEDFLAKPVNSEKLERMILDMLPEEKVIRGERKEGTGNSAADERGEELSLPELEGIDWKYAGLYCPDTEILMDTLNQFYELIETEAKKLEQAEAIQQFRIQVHSMKNSAAMIGAVSLAGVARILEYAARDGKISQIENITPAFLQEWMRMKEILKPVVRVKSQSEATRKVDAEQIGELLRILRRAMEEMDVDTADEMVKQLGEFDYPEGVVETVDAIYLAVTNLDEEQTAELSEQLEQQLKN